MPEPLVTMNLDQLVTGVMPGVNEEHVPLWINATDVIMEDSGVRPAPGYVRPYIDNGFFDDQPGEFDTYSGLFDDAGTRVYLDAIDTAPVKGIHVQKQSDGRLIAVWGTATDLFLFNGITGAVNVTRTTGVYSGNASPSDIVDETQWSFAQWGDWVVATNGADKPQVLKYPGATEFEDLANFPCDSAEIVRVLGPHLLAFNLRGTYTPSSTPTGPNQFVFSKQDDIESWDPTIPGNATAGLLPLRDFAGPIIAVEYLSGRLLAYGETAVHLVEYGGQFLFTGQKGALGIRAVAKNSIASIGSRHIVLTQNGLYACDGLDFQQVAYPALGAWLETVVDWPQRSRIAHQVDVRRSLVKWTLPGVEQDFVLVYNWQTNKLTFESRPFTAGTRVESLWRPLAGFSTGQIQMIIDTPNDRAPELITKPLLVANRARHVFVDNLIGRWSGAAATVQVRYAEQQDELPGLPWEPLGSFTDRENVLWCMREAMFVQLRISSAGVKWLLSGLELIGKPGGGRW
jgi:hypothetical protein